MRHDLAIPLLLLLTAAALAGADRLPSARDHAPADAKHADDDPRDVEDRGLPTVRPHTDGAANARYWGPLSEDEQAAAVKDLKAVAAKAADDLHHPLRLQESRLFLLYSDLSDNEAARWLKLLEGTYARLGDLFGADKGRNVWRGKALVLVFAKVEDYRLFERMVENADPGGSQGMTHCAGDGFVHMAFYRHPRELAFSHLVAHELVHGFVHRYRTPARVPSWANEGLADALASELVNDPRRARAIRALAKADVEKRNGALGAFFTADQIDGWQYPVAETLCAFMIQRDRKAYSDFLDGIKDGQKWDDSLRKSYKLPPEKLLAEYAKAMGLKSVRP